MKNYRSILSQASVIMLLLLMFVACNINFPTYEVKVSGTIVDSKGNPIINTPVIIGDMQRDPNAMFGNLFGKYMFRRVGSTTTDQNGHYSLSVKTEGVTLAASTSYSIQTWDSLFKQVGDTRYDCQERQKKYVLDIVVKTRIEYYTGDKWKEVVDIAPQEVNLNDTIHIKLKDGSMLQSAEICSVDTSYIIIAGETKSLHYYKRALIYCVGHTRPNLNIEEGQTELDMIFNLDPKWLTEDCCIKLESVMDNGDRKIYNIPIKFINY